MHTDVHSLRGTYLVYILMNIAYYGKWYLLHGVSHFLVYCYHHSYLQYYACQYAQCY